MIKGVLLDFNGVVINDEPIQHAAYREVFREYGIDVTDEEYYARLGMDDRTFVTSIFEAAGRNETDKTILEVTAAKNKHWRGIVEMEPPLFDGIVNFIRKTANEMELGIVSMSRREEIDLVLERAGLRSCFSIIISADDITRCKPDPECYRAGFLQLDKARILHGHLPMTHAECLVIEDAPPGIRAAKAAGLPVLAVANTVSEKELREAGANAVAKKLDDWMPETLCRVFV